jgi:hypothetical protein
MLLILCVAREPRSASMQSLVTTTDVDQPELGFRAYIASHPKYQWLVGFCCYKLCHYYCFCCCCCCNHGSWLYNCTITQHRTASQEGRPLVGCLELTTRSTARNRRAIGHFGVCTLCGIGWCALTNHLDVAVQLEPSLIFTPSTVTESTQPFLCPGAHFLLVCRDRRPRPNTRSHRLTQCCMRNRPMMPCESSTHSCINHRALHTNGCCWYECFAHHRSCSCRSLTPERCCYCSGCYCRIGLVYNKNSDEKREFLHEISVILNDACPKLSDIEPSSGLQTTVQQAIRIGAETDLERFCSLSAGDCTLRMRALAAATLEFIVAGNSFVALTRINSDDVESRNLALVERAAMRLLALLLDLLDCGPPCAQMIHPEILPQLRVCQTRDS